MRVRAIVACATFVATPRIVAIELRRGVLFVELMTTVPAIVPVHASKPHQLHLKGRGSEDEVVDVVLHTSSRFRGLMDGFSPSTTSRQRSPPATLLKVFFHFSATQLEF